MEKVARRWSIAGSLTGVALERREVISTLDAEIDIRVDPAILELVASEGLGSAVAVPLIFQDTILGSVSVYFQSARQLSPLERQTLTAIGRTVGVALANVLHIEQLGASLVEQRRTAEALRTAEERLRLVLDTVPTRLFWKDRECRYLGCNNLFAVDAGVATPAHIIGRTDHDLTWRGTADSIQASDRAIMESGQPLLNFETTVDRIDGGLRSVNVSKTPLRDADGAIVGVLGCYDDVTARRRVESELKHSQKMQAMGELTGGVAHEFKNVLSVIITNAAGCGSHLKHYAKLLENDPVYELRAHLWDAKVKDVHEWLVEIGITPVGENVQRSTSNVQRSTTYHEACHLCHGQKITRAPRQVLEGVPGLRLVEMAEATWCCGSAGIYNITQPEMSQKLLARKLANIAQTGASVVASANPGCNVQLEAGARARGLALEIVHPVTLLARAYRGEI